jgi:hypothetical protein
MRDESALLIDLTGRILLHGPSGKSQFNVENRTKGRKA